MFYFYFSQKVALFPSHTRICVRFTAETGNEERSGFTSSRGELSHLAQDPSWPAVEKEEPTILYIQSEPGVPERLNQVVPESFLEKYHVLQNTEKCLLLLRRGVRPVGL